MRIFNVKLKLSPSQMVTRIIWDNDDMVTVFVNNEPTNSLMCHISHTPSVVKEYLLGE